jgi:hypothetical protein
VATCWCKLTKRIRTAPDRAPLQALIETADYLLSRGYVSLSESGIVSCLFGAGLSVAALTYRNCRAADLVCVGGVASSPPGDAAWLSPGANPIPGSPERRGSLVQIATGRDMFIAIADP